MKHRTTLIEGSSLIVLSSLFYGSYGLWSRLMGDSFGAFAQAWIKSLVVVAVLLAIGRVQGWQKIQYRRDYKQLMVLLVSATGIAGPAYYATNRIGIGVAVLIMYASLMLTLFVFGKVCNGERYTRDKQFATVLALVGLWLTFSPSLDIHAALLPMAASALSGICVAIEIVATQKLAYSSSQATMLGWTASAVVNLPVALLLGDQIPASFMDIHWLYLGLFAAVSLGASWSLRHGMERVSAGIAGIIGLLEIVFGVVFGILLFSERPALVVYGGACQILAAAAIPFVVEMRTIKISEQGRT